MSIDALAMIVFNLVAWGFLIAYLRSGRGKSRKDGGRHYVGRSENWNRPRRKEPEC
jgi:hypothetical protein